MKPTTALYSMEPNFSLEAYESQDEYKKELEEFEAWLGEVPSSIHEYEQKLLEWLELKNQGVE